MKSLETSEALIMSNACPGWVRAEVGALESNNLLCHEENDLSLNESIWVPGAQVTLSNLSL